MLQGARSGDTLTFLPWLAGGPLVRGAVLQSATPLSDPAILTEAVNLSSWAHNNTKYDGSTMGLGVEGIAHGAVRGDRS